MLKKDRPAQPKRVLLPLLLLLLLTGAAQAQQPTPTPNGQLQLPTQEQMQQTFDRLFDQTVGRPPDASRYVYARELSALNAALYDAMRKFMLTYERPLRDKVYLICYVLVPIFFIIALLKLAHEPQAGVGSYMLLCLRAVVFIALAVYGAQIINMCGRSGLLIAAPFRAAADQAQTRFNQAFQTLVQNSMIVDWSSGSQSHYGIPEGLYAILFSPQEALANPNESLEHIQTFASDIRNWFYLLVHSQALLQACTTFIMFIGFTIVLMMRVFAPFAVLVGIDRTLAQRITYNYLWGVIAWCLFTPTVMEIFRLIAYGTCRFAVEAATPRPIGINSVTLKLMGANIDTTALGFASFVMITFGLAQFGAPYVAYRLSQGQLAEGVITNLSTWAMTAIGTGIEMIGVRFGATLNRRASELQYYATQRTETGLRQNEYAQRLAGAFQSLTIGNLQARLAQQVALAQNRAAYAAAVLNAQGALRQALLANQTNYRTSLNMATNDTVYNNLNANLAKYLGVETQMGVLPEVADRTAQFEWENRGQYNVAAEMAGGAIGGAVGAAAEGAGAGIGAGAGASAVNSVMGPVNKWRNYMGLSAAEAIYANRPWIRFYQNEANFRNMLNNMRLEGFNLRDMVGEGLLDAHKALEPYNGQVKGLKEIYEENLAGLNRAAEAAYQYAVSAAGAQKSGLDRAANMQLQGTQRILNVDYGYNTEIPKIALYGTRGANGVATLTSPTGQSVTLPPAPGSLELIEQQFRANMRAAELHYTAEVFLGITRDMSRRLEDAIKSVTRY